MAGTQHELNARLVTQAVAELDAILEVHAAGFVHLDRGGLIERLERIRESALAAKVLLTEHRAIV
jgi:hypothetical protein